MIDFIRYILNIDNLIYSVKVLLLWIAIMILISIIVAFIKSIALSLIDLHYKKKFYENAHNMGLEEMKKAIESVYKKENDGDINNDE